MINEEKNLFQLVVLNVIHNCMFTNNVFHQTLPLVYGLLLSINNNYYLSDE
jgi:hypothetical protein